VARRAADTLPERRLELGGPYSCLAGQAVVRSFIYHSQAELNTANGRGCESERERERERA